MKNLIPILFSLLLCACPAWDESTHFNSINIINLSEDGKAVYFSVCSFNGSQYETLQSNWVSVRTDNIVDFHFYIEGESWKTTFLEHEWKAIYIYAFEDMEHFFEWKKKNEDQWALKKYTFSIDDIDGIGFRDVVWIYYPYDGIYSNKDDPDFISSPDHFGNK